MEDRAPKSSAGKTITQTLHVCHTCLHWGGFGGQLIGIYMECLSQQTPSKLSRADHDVTDSPTQRRNTLELTRPTREPDGSSSWELDGLAAGK